MSQDVSGALGDYLEALVELGGTPEVAVRPVDLAAHLSVSKPSVCSAVSTLKRKGLADQPYRGGITLTQKGYDIGAEIRRHHEVATDFLSNVLMLDETHVETGSNIIKYAIDKDSLSNWINFVAAWKAGS